MNQILAQNTVVRSRWIYLSRRLLCSPVTLFMKSFNPSCITGLADRQNFPSRHSPLELRFARVQMSKLEKPLLRSLGAQTPNSTLAEYDKPNSKVHIPACHKKLSRSTCGAGPHKQLATPRDVLCKNVKTSLEHCASAQ